MEKVRSCNGHVLGFLLDSSDRDAGWSTSQYEEEESSKDVEVLHLRAKLISGQLEPGSRTDRSKVIRRPGPACETLCGAK